MITLFRNVQSNNILCKIHHLKLIQKVVVEPRKYDLTYRPTKKDFLKYLL